MDTDRKQETEPAKSNRPDTTNTNQLEPTWNSFWFKVCWFNPNRKESYKNTFRSLYWHHTHISPTYFNMFDM